MKVESGPAFANRQERVDRLIRTAGAATVVVLVGAALVVVGWTRAAEVTVESTTDEVRPSPASLRSAAQATAPRARSETSEMCVASRMVRAVGMKAPSSDRRAHPHRGAGSPHRRAPSQRHVRPHPGGGGLLELDLEAGSWAATACRVAGRGVTGDERCPTPRVGHGLTLPARDGRRRSPGAGHGRGR